MDFSMYPDHAFAFVSKRAKSEGRDDYRRFVHHTSAVKRGNENRTVDLALLHSSLEELQEAVLPRKLAQKAFNHLKNHAKTVIQREQKANVSPEREELHAEIFFLIDEISDNGFEEERFIRLPETPVFRAGIWNGDEYTAEDLYEIVRNFEKLKGSFLPAIKEGHTHGWLAGIGCPKEDEQALGYIVSMRTDGEAIYAVFEVSPDVYYWKFENKSLRYKSCEIYPAWEHNGEDVGKVMTAVAALGVSPPAVGNLGEINLQEFSKKGEKAEIIAIDFEERKNGMKTKTKDFEAEQPKAVEEEPVAVDAVDDAPEQPEEVQDEEVDAQDAAEEEVAQEEEAVEEEAPAEEPAEVVEEPAVDPAPAEVPEVQLNSVQQYSADDIKALIQMNKQLQDKLQSADETIRILSDEHAQRDIEHRVENLIRDGHVAPADRETVQHLFKALQSGNTALTFAKEDGTSEEVQAIELFEKFLTERVAWPTDEVGKVETSEKEDVALREALPSKVEGLPVGYDRDGIPVVKKNTDLAEQAKRLQEEFAAKGKKVDLADCIIQVRKSNK